MRYPVVFGLVLVVSAGVFYSGRHIFRGPFPPPEDETHVIVTDGTHLHHVVLRGSRHVEPELPAHVDAFINSIVKPMGFLDRISKNATFDLQMAAQILLIPGLRGVIYQEKLDLLLSSLERKQNVRAWADLTTLSANMAVWTNRRLRSMDTQIATQIRYILERLTTKWFMRWTSDDKRSHLRQFFFDKNYTSAEWEQIKGFVNAFKEEMVGSGTVEVALIVI